MSNLKAKAKKFFDANPTLHVMYGTNDGKLFYNWGDAKGHCTTIKQDYKSIEVLTRKDAEAEEAANLKDAEAAVAGSIAEVELLDPPAEEVVETPAEEVIEAPADEVADAPAAEEAKPKGKKK